MVSYSLALTIGTYSLIFVSKNTFRYINKVGNNKIYKMYCSLKIYHYTYVICRGQISDIEQRQFVYFRIICVLLWWSLLLT